jgi:anti-sigma regulatory factor (Ser/Thr protein kinase)
MTSPLLLCVRRSPASDAGGEATLVTLRLPSDVGCIEEAVELVVRHCLAGHQATEDQFRLQVILSEAITNAIVRGNRRPGKWVDVRAELLVTSSGSTSATRAGFDPAAVPTQCGAADGSRRRGLYLIRKLVDAVHFNEQGTPSA